MVGINECELSLFQNLKTAYYFLFILFRFIVTSLVTPIMKIFFYSLYILLTLSFLYFLYTQLLYILCKEIPTQKIEHKEGKILSQKNLNTAKSFLKNQSNNIRRWLWRWTTGVLIAKELLEKTLRKCSVKSVGKFSRQPPSERQ